MRVLFKVIVLVFEIFKLRKELKSSLTDSVHWELSPMDFKLDWFVQKGDPFEGDPGSDQESALRR